MPKQKTREISIPGLANLTVKEVPFDIVKEGWDEYKLQDGTLVRVKNIVLKMFLQVDSEGQVVYTNDGDPSVIVVGNQVVVSVAAED